MTERVTTRCCYSRGVAKLVPSLTKCELCKVYVHTSCIGPVTLPYNCITCKQKNNPTCVICGEDKGIMKKISNFRDSSKKTEYIHIICGLLSDHALVTDWNTMKLQVNFDSLEDNENSDSDQKCSICGKNNGQLLTCEKCPLKAHPYCAMETRFQTSQKSKEASEVDNDTQNADSQSEGDPPVPFWKIKIFNKINPEIIPKETREKIIFTVPVPYEDPLSQEESEEEKDSKNEENQTKTSSQENSQKSDKFQYKDNFWKRGGYISVRCPLHKPKPKECFCHYDQYQYDEKYEDELETDSKQDNARPNTPGDGLVICCDHCGIWHHCSCEEINPDLINTYDTYKCKKCSEWEDFKKTTLLAIMINQDPIQQCDFAFPVKPYTFQMFEYMECARAIFCKSAYIFDNRTKLAKKSTIYADILKNLERMPFPFDTVRELCMEKLKSSLGGENMALEELKKYEYKIFKKVFDKDLNTDEEALKYNRNIFSNLKYLADTYINAKIIKRRKMNPDYLNCLKCMKLLALSAQMRDIVIYGELYTIQELVDMHREVSEIFFPSQTNLEEVTWDLREEFLTVTGAIIQDYNIWKAELLKIVKSQQEKMGKIQYHLGNRIEYKIESENFKKLGLTEKFRNSSQVIVRWELLIQNKPSYKEIIDHFEKAKQSLMVNTLEEQELFEEFIGHIDIWTTKYQIVKSNNLPEEMELIEIQMLLEEAAETCLFKFPELIKALEEYKASLNTFLQFDHYINNVVSLSKLRKFINKFKENSQDVNPEMLQKCKGKYKKGKEYITSLENDTKNINTLSLFLTNIKPRLDAENGPKVKFSPSLKAAINGKHRILKIKEYLNRGKPVNLSLNDIYQSITLFSQVYPDFIPEKILQPLHKRLVATMDEIPKLVRIISSPEAPDFFEKLLKIKKRILYNGIMPTSIHKMIKSWAVCKELETEITQEMQGFSPKEITYQDIIVCLEEQKIQEFNDLEEKGINQIKGETLKKLIQELATADWALRYRYWSRKQQRDRGEMKSLKNDAEDEPSIQRIKEYSIFIKDMEALEAYDHFLALSYDKSQIRDVLELRNDLSREINFAFNIMKVDKKNEQSLIKKIKWKDLFNQLQEELNGENHKKRIQKEKSKENDYLLDCDQLQAMDLCLGLDAGMVG
ncbi:unnamed protein product [Moneuplotes crassus]|uniref:Zinc finger PHD-type domain-containing protein n=1 Tax=Euplotes crassus TaxID=5936 RepID=A0AAD2CXR1_EUPCR|nr:unnamed protein product [Moneuplotes crassus]